MRPVGARSGPIMSRRTSPVAQPLPRHSDLDDVLCRLALDPPLDIAAYVLVLPERPVSGTVLALQCPLRPGWVRTTTRGELPRPITPDPNPRTTINPSKECLAPTPDRLPGRQITDALGFHTRSRARGRCLLGRHRQGRFRQSPNVDKSKKREMAHEALKPLNSSISGRSVGANHEPPRLGVLL